MMNIYPAIDLKSGNCVRLIKGDFNQETIYNNDPVEVAKQFEKSGATWIHIIDLDGAYDGNNKNIEVIKEILLKTNIKIQFGGGIRDIAKIRMLLNLGISRVILGSFAITNLDDVAALIKEFPSKIIVSVDSKNGFVTYNGWQKNTEMKTIDFCKKLEEIGCTTIVYTDIAKDGMMQGPNFEDYEMLNSLSSLDVIASGGVRDSSDILRLQKANVEGAIIGKSLYINNVTLEEVFSCLQEE